MAVKKRRSNLEIEAIRELHANLRDVGLKVRLARKRRRWTQKHVGRRAELAQQTISQMERGDGATLSIAAWKRACMALSVPFEIKLGRDAMELPADAGHLSIQEFMLRLGRRTGYDRTFELQTSSTDPARSTDVGLVSHAKRRLVRIECVNTFGNIGDAVRSSDRKQREAEGLAIALGHGEPYSVHEVWVVRSTRRNRELIARYPEIFASRFPGSSREWVQALLAGTRPPVQQGLVWCDLHATRLFEWRHGPIP
jgi:transcriptional regulator with XRE-family HTH domain